MVHFEGASSQAARCIADAHRAVSNPIIQTPLLRPAVPQSSSSPLQTPCPRRRTPPRCSTWSSSTWRWAATRKPPRRWRSTSLRYRRVRVGPVLGRSCSPESLVPPRFTFIIINISSALVDGSVIPYIPDVYARVCMLRKNILIQSTCVYSDLFFL